MATYITTTHTATNKVLYSGTRVIWFALSVVEVMLGFRFVLHLFGANSQATFTRFVYDISSPLIAPFRFVFSNPDLGVSIVEFGTLLAMVVYWVLAWGVIRLILLGRPVSEIEASHRVSKQDSR